MENQQKVWNSIAKLWKKFRVKSIKEVQEFLKNKKGNILDLGCGAGRNFVKNKGIIYGIDFSKEMLKYAKESAEKNNVKVKLKRAKATKIPFKDNFFDSAIYISVLHCIPSEKDREKSLKGLLRVLKPNAEALITVWSKNHVKLINHPKDSTIVWKTKTKKIHRYYYLYEKKELLELLENVKFKIISIKEDNKNIIAKVQKT